MPKPSWLELREVALRREVVALGGSRLIRSSLSRRVGLEKLEGAIVTRGHRAEALQAVVKQTRARGEVREWDKRGKPT